MIFATLKVAFSLDRAVILARGLIKRHADPVADSRDLGNEADIGDGASTSIRFGKNANTGGEGKACCDGQLLRSRSREKPINICIFALGALARK